MGVKCLHVGVCASLCVCTYTVPSIILGTKTYHLFICLCTKKIEIFNFKKSRGLSAHCQILINCILMHFGFNHVEITAVFINSPPISGHHNVVYVYRCIVCACTALH